jgi:lipopolysaccharide/colanic/teichoic acid biosynthesis glycosyltransferase
MQESYNGKRAFDLLAVGAACLLLAPLALPIAVATVAEDGGPALFVQTRIGYRRRPFEVLKFRTMRDGNVTRVGHWLRRTGLDELPQFINVCRGEMSVVGPRPLTAADVARLGWDAKQFDWRFSSRPGITGMAQLLAGQGAAFSRRLDRLYGRRQNPALDLQLIALSFAVNLVGKRRLRKIILGARGKRASTAPPMTS